MISSWMIYLITRLAGIKFISGGLCIISFIMIIVLSICESDYEGGMKALFSSGWFKAVIITAVTSGLLFFAIPTPKEAVAIWLVPKIINNEDVQGSIEKLPKFANKYLEKELIEFMKGDEASGSSND